MTTEERSGDARLPALKTEDVGREPGTAGGRQELGKARKQTLPQSLHRYFDLSRVRPMSSSNLQNCERMNLSAFSSHRICGNLLWQQKKTNTTPEFVPKSKNNLTAEMGQISDQKN